MSRNTSGEKCHKNEDVLTENKSLSKEKCVEKDNTHHQHDHDCGCHHDHREEHDCDCGCHHEHHKEHDCDCGCHHEHHEAHDSDCGCHHEHHKEHDCDCGCHHEHDDDCGCGCGHDHGASQGKPLWKTILRYLLGAIPIIIAFIPAIWLPVRIAAAVIAYAIFGFEVWRGMFRGFKRRKIFTEFTLMCVASIGAFAIGEFADAAAVVFLYSLGETISDRAYARSKRNVSELLEISPEYANVIRNGETARVRPEEVELGETVLVLTGERVPIDGVVTDGGGDADTSSVTGESTPLSLYAGVACPSGAVLTGGSVKLKTTATYHNSVVSRLTAAVAEASKRKAASEKKITRFASVFTPIAFCVAILVTLIGSLVTHDIFTWLKAGLVVLVVSCPCSLVLSVPLTYFAGIGSAASLGIIFRGGEVMDSMKNVKSLAFDKTGTLTRSKLDFDGVELLGDIEENEFLEIASDVLTYSPHAAAVSYCGANPPKNVYTVEDPRNIGGRGIVCLVENRAVAFGNAALMRELGIELEDSKTTAIFGAIDGKLQGKLNFSSHLKDGVTDTIRGLQRLGVGRIAIISGDGYDSVESASREAGIDEFYASVTPDKKADILGRIIEDTRKRRQKSRVAYCGDGLNDSAVIALADVGVAMGDCGAALTVDSADVILMDDNISKLEDSIIISRRTSAIASQNIVISLGIKIAVLMIGVIISAFGGSVPMELAIAADVGAAIIAVANASRAGSKKRSKRKKKNEKR